MKRSPKREHETASRFAERYARTGTPVFDVIEREVVGANVGLNGYTTVAQARRLARELRLTRDALLLDVGAGNGWPGLYIIGLTGCRAVLSDVPASAVQNAATRARRTRTARRCEIVRASASALPFQAGSFDAIVHTDVMC